MSKAPKRQASASERFWEILPGALEWTTFVLLFLLSWLAPVVVSYFIMLYSLIWLEKSVHSSAHLLHTFRKLRLARHKNWDKRLAQLEDIPAALAALDKQIMEHKKARPGLYSGLFLDWRAEHKRLRHRRKELEQLSGRTDLFDWKDVWHVVLFPTYNEPAEVLIQSIESVRRAHVDHRRVIVVVGVEERAGQAGTEKARVLKERFADSFAAFVTVTHPDGIEGEAKVKSANATYALWRTIPELEKRGINLDRVLISNFDSDTQMAPEYFRVLTEAFVMTPNRLRTSYQPVPVFNNNMWQAPMMARLSATGTSFWQMIESSRSHRLVSFSSHAVPLRAVIDVNGWDVTRISEDSRIFWQCYMRYDGDYHVVPLATTVSMDAVQDENWWKTLVALYKQKRRWAWGVENLSFLGTNFVGKNCVRVPWRKRLVHLGRMIEGHHSWGTTAIILALGGWLPSILGGPEFTNSVLGINYLYVTRVLLTLALLGIVVSIFVSTRMLPKRPKSVSAKRSFSLVVQWLLTPLVTIFFGSLPALDAHWRLMMGRYMEFQVMPKVRDKS